MNNLFVCGVPRSGTTVLAEVLSAHSRVVLGIERFKRCYRRPDFGPSYFSKTRFCSLVDGDCDRAKEQIEGELARAAQKFDDAMLVGDKYPMLYNFFALFRNRFPNAKWVYIVRNPVEVGMSWEARAKNPKDKWPEENGAIRSISEYNKSLIAVLKALKDNNSFLVINYHRLFHRAFGVNEAERLLHFLGLPECKLFTAAHTAALKRSALLGPRRSVAPPDVADAIETQLHARRLLSVCSKSKCGLTGMPKPVLQLKQERDKTRQRS